MPSYSPYIFISFLVFGLLLYAYRLLINKFAKGSALILENGAISGGGVVLSVFITAVGCVYDPTAFIVLGMVFLGYADDLWDISARLRLLIYGLGIGFILFLFSIHLIGIILLFFLFVGYLILVNGMNFMDGMNGMVTTQMLVIVSWILCVVQVSHDLTIILCGLIGFLLAMSMFNFRSKALLMLGDAGSIGLGFLMGLIVMKAGLNNFVIGDVLIFAVFGIDVLATLVIRWHRGERLMEGHQQHLYQLMLARTNFGPRFISIAYSVVQGLILVIWSMIRKSDFADFGFACILFFLLVLYFVLRYRTTNGLKVSE